jgi:hypothetical protein
MHKIDYMLRYILCNNATNVIVKQLDGMHIKMKTKKGDRITKLQIRGVAQLANPISRSDCFP